MWEKGKPHPTARRNIKLYSYYGTQQRGFPNNKKKKGALPPTASLNDLRARSWERHSGGKRVTLSLSVSFVVCFLPIFSLGDTNI